MIDIDYNKLKCFLVIVESGSITLASKKLFRTQSAVSQTLHNLEQSLGISLIEWKGKQLKLTREGQLIYYAACSHIKAVHSQILTIIDAGKEVGGCVEIGVLKDRSTNVQEYLLNSLVKFKNRYPLVKFKLNFGTSLEIEQGLLNQKKKSKSQF